MEQSINLPATANQAENFFSLATFSDAHKVAGVLAKSKLIPANFQNNVPDCIIAMEMSQRIGASIFSVMQSLYIVHGRAPSRGRRCCAARSRTVRAGCRPAACAGSRRAGRPGARSLSSLR